MSTTVDSTAVDVEAVAAPGSITKADNTAVRIAFFMIYILINKSLLHGWVLSLGSWIAAKGLKQACLLYYRGNCWAADRRAL